MKIEIDMSIGAKIVNKVNEYFDKNKTPPTKITLNSDQYRDLWLMTYYTWTRKLDEPHCLTRYCDCDLIIGLTNEIICS